MKLNNALVIGWSFVLLTATGCVQETHVKSITFKVDMNEVEKSADVGVRGDLIENWTETFPLDDSNNDGIYEGVFKYRTATNRVQFKFVNNNSDYELEGSDNRVIQFDYRPETIVYEAVFEQSQPVKFRKK